MIIAARRPIAVLLAGIALLGGATAGSASARAGTTTLLVTTLDRTGHAVRSQFATKDVRTGATHYFWTGRAHRVPAARYEVFAAIGTPLDGSTTVGVRRVRVTGATRLTMDARRGQAVRGYLQPAAGDGYLATTQTWLCDGTGEPLVGGGSFGTVAYAIPTGLDDVELAYSSIWTTDDPSGHGQTWYAGVATHRHGVPAGMTRVYHQADLANFVVRGRSGPQSGDADVDIRYGSGDACRQITLQLFARATLPYAISMHVPAGHWSTSQFAQDSVYGRGRQFAAGHSYRVTLGAAAWGPDGSLPVVDQYCRCLELANSRMFTDQVMNSVGAGSRVSYTLRKGKDVLLRVTADPEQSSTHRRLPAKGWYTLTEVATRRPIKPLPAGVLSLRTSLRMHFHADPAKAGQVGGYVTRFVPTGLGSDNRTAAVSTSVWLEPQRRRFVPFSRPAVRSVRAWASYDGGRSWHTATVHRSAGRWTAAVANPGSGFVSLRAKIVDADGNSTTTTVIRAYGIR